MPFLRIEILKPCGHTETSDFMSNWLKHLGQVRKMHLIDQEQGNAFTQRFEKELLVVKQSDQLTLWS